MADIWNVGVARVDDRGNLYLNGGISYNQNSLIFIPNGVSATENGQNLLSSYERAKELTPFGGELSAKNRVCIVLAPGIYDLGAETLNINTDFIDIIAEKPEVITASHSNYSLSHPDQGSFLDNHSQPGWQGDLKFPLPRTRVIGTPTGGGSVVDQSCEDVRLIGFSIECYWDGDTSSRENGFNVSSSEGGKLSVYIDMTFFSDIKYNESPLGIKNRPTNHEFHFRGEWTNCIANDYAFRLENKMGSPNTQKFSPVMTNCYAGIRSFAGDSVNGNIEGAILTGCTAPGSAFGGCVYEAMGCDSDTIYTECKAIPYGRSFSLGDPFDGKLIRCEGGEFCAGSTVSSGQPGTFTGIAEDCTFGQGSLGGSGDGGLGFPSGETFFNNGTVIRCTVSESESPMQLKGAEIIDSNISASLDGVDAIRLIDGNSKIIGSVIEVNDSGVGVPINASSAQNVIIVNCSMNNGANDADGIGVNVTNTALTASNGIY